MVDIVDLLAPFGLVLGAIAVAALLYFVVTTIKSRRSGGDDASGRGGHAH
ncbi:hypothetical protein [Collinsella intestinalis]|nr:hypothetical protein [Collinsella intestinalis]MBM6682358.1 hypothetical protein [Collinsella intestinalis]